jgi:hypothetical protein
MSSAIEKVVRVPDEADQEKGLGKIDRPPTSDGSVASDVVENAAAGDDEQNEQPTMLPFSKGRCISLVLTVTGAAFLNVSDGIGWKPTRVC